MEIPFAEEQLAQLKMFIQVCKMKPQIIQHPKLSFFKEYLLSLGVTLPTATFEPTADSGENKSEPKKETNNAGANNASAPADTDEESEPESDVELDMEGVIESDTFCDQEMGDENKEVTDDDREKSDEKRSEAMRAFSEQQFDDAITFYTEAIRLNPQSALLFAKRGQVFLKQNKLHACIKDCTRALELNCDSAAAYKFRGRAYRLLGNFEEASHDLCESLKIDYDDQANEWLAEVKPNAEKLRQHRLSAQRKKEEKEHRDKVRRARAAQEAREKAAREQAAGGMPGGMPGMPGGMPGMPGGMPGMPGGMPGMPGGLDLGALLSDPEVMAAIEDPEVMAAFIDVSSNPANLLKYQNKPKVLAALEIFKRKFSFGAGGAPPPADGAQKPPTADDVGLD